MHRTDTTVPASREERAVAAFSAYVASPGFPCVGARSAFNTGRVRFGSYGRLGAADDVHRLCAALRSFSDAFPAPGDDPVTYVATFDAEPLDEPRFAERMWRHLQSIHEHDARTFAWDPAVSADPAQPDFSFSVAGRAFFVVGLHPAASRLARRAPMPSLVFNFHDQFEHMRSSGRYAGLQKATRRRDLAVQGSINPVLERFGDASEARQYSGQSVGPGWKCPFRQVEMSDA